MIDIIGKKILWRKQFIDIFVKDNNDNNGMPANELRISKNNENIKYVNIQMIVYQNAFCYKKK